VRGGGLEANGTIMFCDGTTHNAVLPTERLIAY
jgi:hypothetical protein